MTGKKIFTVSAKLDEEVNSFIHEYADLNNTSVSQLISDHFQALYESEKSRHFQFKRFFEEFESKPGKQGNTE